MIVRSPGARPPEISPDLLPLQRLYYWETTAPERVYLVQPHDGGRLRNYSWREAANEVRMVAAYLKAQNWPAGSRIAILGKNTAGWVLADLAIWMAGHVSVPLYPMQTADNIRQIVSHSGALACFVGKLDDHSMLAGIGNDILTIALPLAEEAVLRRSATTWSDILEHSTPLAGNPVRAGDDLATIVYTSGTTGQAKGVMHSFDTLTAGLRTLTKHTAATTADRAISYLPLAHIMERVAVELGSLDSGLTLYFAESLATFADDLRRARPTIFVSVPRLWLKFQHGVLAKVPQQKLDRLIRLPLVSYFIRRKILRQLGLDQTRIAASGSAPLAADVKHWFASLGLPIYEGYGMTEVGNASHSEVVGGFSEGTVGRPGDHVDHRIDPDTGEVQVLTPGAMLGYYKAPELTAEFFTPDGWVRTGDMGVIDADNRLRLVGRLKDNFKSSKGKYVAPAPIEHRLVQHAMVDACMVLGAGLQQPVGVVVLSEAARTGLPGSKSAIAEDFARHLEHVNLTLDPHEQLACIVLTTISWSPDNGMLTPTLKVRRPQIEKHFGAHAERWLGARTAVVWME